MNKDKFLELCFTVFKDDIEGLAGTIEEWGAKYDNAYKQSKNQYLERFEELYNLLFKV